ncbi:MAG: ankyrin repeat domain-containing protein [Phycisphaerales bacterium]
MEDARLPDDPAPKADTPASSNDNQALPAGGTSALPLHEWPPLHRATRVGDEAAIRALAASGADLNAVLDIRTDPDERPRPATPLMVAAGSGDGATEATVRLLLELGADPNVVLESHSAATLAFEGLGWGFTPGGDAARARAILDAGTPLPQNPRRANDLLCNAAATGDAERVRLLLERGLNPHGHWDKDEAREDHQRMMRGVSAVRREMPDPLDGWSEDMRQDIAESIRKAEEEFDERLCSAPWSMDIPLFRAAESGSAACVQLLIDAGADPTRRDCTKRTAMYSASSVEAILVLVHAGLSLEDADEFGWSPLAVAISDGEDALPRIRALLEAGADVNATHDHGYTVFMSAVGSDRRPAVLRLLVASGADPHAVSEFGYNAFHAAIDVNGEANAEESVRGTFAYLKELGVSLEHRNADGQTPLARAIESGTGIEVRVLCELGAEANAACPCFRCGDEACASTDMPLLLHAAAGFCVQSDVKIEALLRTGADPLATDPNGHTPSMHVAARICADAENYETAYDEFFKGLEAVRLEGKPMPTSRDEFIAVATPFVRAFVEAFAGAIPVKETSQFAHQRREEHVAGLVSLIAYEGWARHERVKTAGS